MSSGVVISTRLFSRATRTQLSLAFLPRMNTTALNSAMCAEITACCVANPVSNSEFGRPNASTSLIRSDAYTSSMLVSSRSSPASVAASSTSRRTPIATGTRRPSMSPGALWSLSPTGPYLVARPSA